MIFRYFVFLFPLFLIQNIHAFARLQKKTTVIVSKTFESVDVESPLSLGYRIQKKCNAVVKLVRPVNILPTIIIGISGGWIMNPSIIRLFKTKEFLISNMIILMIMSNSMILNDIFDVSIDKDNNPTRPLVVGHIKITEAILLSLLFLSGSQFLNMKFIPHSLQYIPNLANILILMYTPFLKRIPFIKNIACSLLIGLSLLFTGFCANPTSYQDINRNFPLLVLASQMLFAGSYYNELLLDICDVEGDRKNKVYTLPVLLGEKETLKVIGNITVLNILWCAINLTSMYGIYEAIVMVIFCFPFLKNLLRVHDSNYSKDTIKHVVRDTVKPMISCLLLFCLLSL